MENIRIGKSKWGAIIATVGMITTAFVLTIGTSSANDNVGIENPNLVSPPAGAVISDNKPAFEWENLNVENYDLWVDNDIDFSFLQVDVTVTDNIYSVKDANSLSDDNYYWKVRSRNNTGAESDWSEVRNFTVDTENPTVEDISVSGMVSVNGMKVKTELLGVQLKESADLNNLLSAHPPWLSSDVDYSLNIRKFHENTIMWVFGDTTWGTVENGERQIKNFTNDSVALQNVEENTIRFYDNDIRNIVTQPKWNESDEAPWCYGAFTWNDTIYFYGAEVKWPLWPVDPVFFASVDNPRASPDEWTTTNHNIEEPFHHMRIDDVNRVDNQLYMYGQRKRFGERDMIVARVQENLTNVDSWKWYDGEQWVSEPSVVSNGPKVSPEYFVDYIPGIDKYVLIQYGDWTKPSVYFNWSNTPVGPWHKDQVLFEAPKYLQYENLYADSMENLVIHATNGHAHYGLDFPNQTDELIVSYFLRYYGETEGWFVTDTRINRPYFVKVDFPPNFKDVVDETVENFSLKVKYSESMDTSIDPTISFSPNIKGEILENESASWNEAGNIYTWTYDVADADVEKKDVVATVSGGQDDAGNTAGTGNTKFDVTIRDVPEEGPEEGLAWALILVGVLAVIIALLVLVWLWQTDRMTSAGYID